MQLEDQPTISTAFGTAMSGVNVQDIIHEDEEVRFTAAAKAREEARDQVNREQNEEKDGKKSGKGQDGAKPDQNAAPAPDSGGPDFKPRYGYRSGVYDTHPDYLTIRGLYKTDRRTGQKTIDPDRLRTALMASIIDKGWHGGVAIYKGNHIDKQATAAAESMLATDPALLHFLEARGIGHVPVQRQLVPGSPPKWLQSDRERAGHEKRCVQQARENIRGQMDGLKEAQKKFARGFHAAADGTTMYDDLGRVRAEMKARMPQTAMGRTFNAAVEALGLKSSAAIPPVVPASSGPEVSPPA